MKKKTEVEQDNKNKKPIIGIIGGTGKMGMWFQHFFTSRGYEVLISGRKTPLHIPELVKKSDIIMLSVPISSLEKTIHEIAPLLKHDQLVTDIASLKSLPMREMEQLPCGTLGMHPLFGPSIAVPRGQKIVFCKQKNNVHVDFLRKEFTDVGLEIIAMSAEEHDYHMAYIQALTHALNLLYAKIIFDQKDALSKKLDTPLFMLQSLVMGRVLQQDLGLSSDIQMYNPYFLPLLENLAGYSKQLLDILQKGDNKAFVKLFRDNHLHGKEFANFAVLHTDKILKLVSEVHSKLPTQQTITLNKTAKIAYLGPKGTYSHQATETVFPDKITIPKETIFGVFNSVLEDDVDFGVVPAENSIEGTVKGVLDYLVDFSLHVVGSFALPIHHQMASTERSIYKIDRVISHPQALAQCEQYLRKNLPNAQIIPSASTTSDMVKKEAKTAYICSSLAAKLYGLPILEKDIEDNPHNATRFYVIAKQQMDLKGLNNTKTLIFLTIYNRVGILRDILNVIADHGLNLTKLESRPSYEKVWDYHFFVEIDVKHTDKSLGKALKALEVYCPVIRVLGQT